VGTDVPDPLLTGTLLYADDRFDEVRAVWEQGFAAARDAGDDHQAVRLAIALVDLHTSVFANRAAGNGWRARAQRILERLGPCVEQGYYELAEIACGRLDVDELLRSADRALQIADEYGDRGLEVRALADRGLALVSQGEIDAGFGFLDEALATICAGEVEDPIAIGISFCSLLTSCERAADVRRAEEWIRLVNELVLDPLGGRPKILGTHCRAAYGAVLSDAGRWPEAEAAMLDAIGPDGSRSLVHRSDTATRLAHLRIAQGRLDEAAELLAPYEDRVASAAVLAELHLRRGEPGVAVAVAWHGLESMRNDVTRRRPLLMLLVEAALESGDRDAAADAAAELEALADRGGPAARADAWFARARLAAADEDLGGAAELCSRAATDLEADAFPARLLAVLAFQAEVLADAGERDAAVATGRSVLALAQRLGAAADADRAAARLRALGVTVRRAGTGGTAGLTSRETEVLELLGSGATNAEIGARLFIAPKTVEHHVSRILAKLGVRTRAEAAAVAATGPAEPGPR
jgi:DNA-binding CsgD family transcriptional regulator/tetratricopeptide (TPR) repeat protein